MDALINGIYPPGYFNLVGVSPITPPSELWWSSRERMAFENGVATSEYIEVDLGRLRSFNFLNFNTIQKPFDVTIEYDVWNFESGVHNWLQVTRLGGERFDSHITYQANSVNPWASCQFYFTDSRGDMISTRYLRLGFHRRNDTWPNAALTGTFPWSIDVRNLRTSRYLVTINDARGILVNQAIVPVDVDDAIKYIDADTVTMHSVAFATELMAGVDGDIGLLISVPGGIEDYIKVGTDHDTITLISVPSGFDAHGYFDAGLVTEISVPSGTDLYPYKDTATITEISVVSSLEEHDYFDNAVAKTIAVPSGADIQSPERYADVKSRFATYAAAKAFFPTYNDMKNG